MNNLQVSIEDVPGIIGKVITVRVSKFRNVGMTPTETGLQYTVEAIPGADKFSHMSYEGELNETMKAKAFDSIMEMLRGK